MSKKPYWSVTVSIDGDPVLTIDPNMLSGIPDIEKFGDQVRAAGENLLAFIGDGSIPPCFVCGATDGVDPGPDCPVCRPEITAQQQTETLNER